MLFVIILASLAVSLVAFVGLFVVFKKKNLADSQLNFLVSLAIGTLLGAVFLHLLPELAEQEILNFAVVSKIILASIVAFFILETILHWHHCRHDECHGHKNKKQLIYMNLIGDGIHNFVDGALLASSFMVDIKLGIIVTLAVIVHEIPQELSDFGVLLYAGLTKARALFYNFLSACIAIIGAILAYTFAQEMILITPILLAIASGNFIYLAAADLIPEIHHQREAKRLFQSVITIIAGILIMVVLNIFIAVE